MEKLVEHYKFAWKVDPSIYIYDKGPFNKISPNFRVLEFSPIQGSHEWIYSTLNMSNYKIPNPIELHIHSAKKDPTIIELLTCITYYHQNTRNINLNDTINFGRPWQEKSQCSFGLISLPYLDGPSLENFLSDSVQVKCYWLIPITETEKRFALNNSINALEEKFENSGFNYLDPYRFSVV
ncbi:MAG: suppressor of fused domain protein [Bacteroidetes bacterium]|nr:suppressor of fused domain protein [Bacteroidota bacterium]